VSAQAALVVGLGSPDRGDDAAGTEVARAVVALALPQVDVVEHEDPTDLIELWSGRDTVVVIDAVCSDAAPGTVHVLETGAGRDPLAPSAWARTGRGGTHAFGLAAAIELARVLRRLPGHLVLVGIEAESFEHGASLSPAVAAGVPGAVRAVVHAVRVGPAAAPVAERGRAHVSG
jgi:hydrogenase maturation protease